MLMTSVAGLNFSNVAWPTLNQPPGQAGPWEQGIATLRAAARPPRDDASDAQPPTKPHPANPHQAPESEPSHTDSFSADPLASEAFRSAVDLESRRRFDHFLTGVERYRAHPYRRTLEEPPVVWSEGTTRLLDYSEPGAEGPPVLIIPSLINRSYILDLRSSRSLVRSLARQNLRPFLVDWAAPGPLEGDFDLSDYIVGRLHLALQAVVEITGQPTAVLGYCMGGLLALALALRAPAKIGALALLATPWDFHKGAPQHAAALRSLRPQIEAMIAMGKGMPVDLLQSFFAALDPLAVERKFRAFAQTDPASARARDFVAIEDWLNDGVPLVSRVARESLLGWYGDNDAARGAWLVSGRPVVPQELNCPCLVMVPERDRIVPPQSALALAEAVPNAECVMVSAGHVGMVAGGTSQGEVYGPLSRWLKERLLGAKGA